MACIKWEDTWLLYTSGELSETDKSAYESHIAECDECRNEYNRYFNEKNSLFVPANLEINVPESVDHEIKRVIHAQRSGAFTGIFFGVLFKKVAIGALFVIIGISGGFYVATYRSGISTGTEVAGQQIHVENLDNNQNAVLADSLLSDSLGEKRIPFSNRRGQLPASGTIPVDVSR